MSVIAGLWSEVEARPDHDVLRLRGSLSLATVPRVRSLLDELLHGRGAVVVDLAGTKLAWAPAVEVFPSALAAAGGWPAARLVLAGAEPDLEERLRAQLIHHAVPLADDPAAAAGRLRHRPDRVWRQRDLPAAVGAPRMARALVWEACADWSATAAQDTVALVANELVTNAVQHARSPCRLSVSLDPTGLRVAARDYALGSMPRLRPVDATRAGGRGLHLVAMLAAAWGVQVHADGKTTWALISLS
jgi:anti-sigma regulatory factor (Ser/Thr protein kinase)